MHTSLFQEIRNFFSRGSVLARLIGINVAIFIAVNLIRVFFFLWNVDGAAEAMSQWLGISSNIYVVLHRPWTLITYMFLHFDFLHILFNMIVLYVGGRLFSDFIGQDRLTATYLLGGLTGALFYIISFNVFPVFEEVVASSLAIGASASVLAIFIAIAAYMPDYQLPLLLFGRIRLKYIAIFFVVLDLISIDHGNPGGHLAHLGGALWGYLYARLLRSGRDPAMVLGFYLEKMIRIFRKKPTMRVEYTRERYVSDEEYNRQRAAQQEKIDKILDKISRHGYDSLTREEKQLLFKMGDK
ncbi:MAG: rhomboid family intramembrane serine protease [Bacteroidales bacterium]